MPHFETNPHRHDPYRNFRFRVKWDSQYVEGVNYVSPLTWTTDVVEVREGGDPKSIRKVPGTRKFSPIILKRGFTRDTAFEDWANEMKNAGAGLTNFHKDIVIDLFDEADHRVLSFIVHRCWVSEYQAIPDFDAEGDAVAIESIRLENEGWERDRTVVPPATAPPRRAVERRKR